MGAKYIFRLDDISWDMNVDNFNKIETIFKKYGVKPLLGIIPNNNNEKLKNYSKNTFMNYADFWNKILLLQNDCEWCVALHGYDHVYLTKNSGILGINKRSEFAGVSEEIQEKKIILGKRILQNHGLKISAFMAPAHSFDEITLEVLKRNEINVITDGQSIYPFYKDNVYFIPQLIPNLWRFPFGIFTICLHPNSMSDSDFKKLDKFIKKNYKNIIGFKDSIAIAKNQKYTRLINFLCYLPIKILLILVKQYVIINSKRKKNHE